MALLKMTVAIAVAAVVKVTISRAETNWLLLNIACQFGSKTID
ncbi:MAG: hypothetical protein ACRC06_09600 [Waterburya sp.]